MTQVVDLRQFGFHRVIRYRGNFDFDGLYKYIRGWLVKRDWDFFELSSKERPPVSVYKVYARKKMSYYIMLQIDLEIWIYEPKPVEIVKDGAKKKLTNGRMKIIVSGSYITDYDGDFEKSATMRKAETLLNDYILYHELFLKVFDYIDYYLYDIMTDIKKYLSMFTDTSAY